MTRYDAPQLTSLDRFKSSYLMSSVRERKTDLCNDTAQAYTGYIDIGARHFFFYFFESRANPETDDVIFWTNGGPGGSAAIGLFVELGPCAILNENAVGRRVDSWSNHANLLFVDQPIGTGFSFAEYGEYVDTTEEAALDMAVFVTRFFEHFSKFQGNGFHFAGESYAGRFLPVFASTLYDQIPYLAQLGLPPVNLTSVMIGQPSLIVGWRLDGLTLVPISELDTDPIRCEGLNPYDVSGKTCDWEQEMCYPEMGSELFQVAPGTYRNADGTLNCSYVTSFLNLPSTRALLGIDPSFRSNFTSVSMDVYNAFDEQLDQYKRTPLHVAALLERGVRVLVYVGNYDWICNWVGNERWTRGLEWSGQEEFISTPLREWHFGGKRAGITRNAGPFTFATIDGGGHLAPMDKPRESVELIRRWISRQDL
ncbi:hypothetical protein V5O48_003621 [Marasmius crinis-equi]|uniref:carboxypeptidase C n=1 Tax=Marasmius crinis-equi TaxID=585013 RepID=A0ABR3FSR6_9AGAR